MAAHVCPECGLMHDAVTPQESEAVTLARIAKEQAVEVAKIQARQERDYNESREKIAETEGEATVGAAEAEAGVIAAVLTADDGQAEEEEAEPAPVIVDAPEIDDEEIDEEAPPAADDHQPKPPKKPRGLGFW